jgi:hypothetical protein
MCEKATEENIVRVLILATKLTYPEPSRPLCVEVSFVKILLRETIKNFYPGANINFPQGLVQLGGVCSGLKRIKALFGLPTVRRPPILGERERVPLRRQRHWAARHRFIWMRGVRVAIDGASVVPGYPSCVGIVEDDGIRVSTGASFLFCVCLFVCCL